MAIKYAKLDSISKSSSKGERTFYLPTRGVKNQVLMFGTGLSRNMVSCNSVTCKGVKCKGF